MIYFDNNATTPLLNEVAECMKECMDKVFANPSSPHRLGKEAKEVLEEARKKVAESINAPPSSIIFTSGGTEANNLAIIGTAFALRKKGTHIITQKTEHASVLEPLKFLEKQGFNVTYLDVDRYGQIHPLQVADAIRDDTVLVTVMYANNETGTLQPIKEIAEITKEAGVYLHTDAVQALGKIPVDVEELGVDLASFSAHKLYGPKGIGALYRREGVRIAPIIHGGGHEEGWRAGTENIVAAVGFGKASSLVKNLLKNMEKIKRMRDELEDRLLQIEGVHVNGHPSLRLPNTLNISFTQIEAETLVASLNAKGIAVSIASACSARKGERSHVLSAMGIEPHLLRGAIRISLGIYNTEEHIEVLIKAIKTIIRL